MEDVVIPSVVIPSVVAANVVPSAVVMASVGVLGCVVLLLMTVLRVKLPFSSTVNYSIVSPHIITFNQLCNLILFVCFEHVSNIIIM